MDRLIPLSTEQIEKLPFPPGANVYIYDDSQQPPCIDSFGSVSGAFLRTGAGVTPVIDFLYKVDINVRGEKETRSELLLGKQLRFRNGTPVHVLKKDEDSSKQEFVEGIVLGACDVPNDDRRKYMRDEASFWYSIQIIGHDEDGMSELMHEVSPSDVTYRALHVPNKVILPNSMEETGTLTSQNNNNDVKIKTEPDVIDLIESETQSTNSSQKRQPEHDYISKQEPEPDRYHAMPKSEPDRYASATAVSLSPAEGNREMAPRPDEPPPKRLRMADDNSFRAPYPDRTSDISDDLTAARQGIPYNSAPDIPDRINTFYGLGVPDRVNSLGSTNQSFEKPRKVFELRNPPKFFEFHAVIDVPVADRLIVGAVIGVKGRVHKQLMSSSGCFIVAAGDWESSQVQVHGDNPENVERGVREVKRQVITNLENHNSKNYDWVQDKIEVEYFQNGTLVNAHRSNSTNSNSRHIRHALESDKTPRNRPPPSPPRRKVRTEYSDTIYEDALRLALPGTRLDDIKKLFTGTRAQNHKRLLYETGCMKINVANYDNGRVPPHINVRSPDEQCREDAGYRVLDYVESELGPIPDAYFIYRRKFS